jgi:hypothetical protein
VKRIGGFMSPKAHHALFLFVKLSQLFMGGFGLLIVLALVGSPAGLIIAVLYLGCMVGLVVGGRALRKRVAAECSACGGPSHMKAVREYVCSACGHTDRPVL